MCLRLKISGCKALLRVDFFSSFFWFYIELYSKLRSLQTGWNPRLFYVFRIGNLGWTVWKIFSQRFLFSFCRQYFLNLFS